MPIKTMRPVTCAMTAIKKLSRERRGWCFRGHTWPSVQPPGAGILAEPHTLMKTFRPASSSVLTTNLRGHTPRCVLRSKGEDMGGLFPGADRRIEPAGAPWLWYNSHTGGRAARQLACHSTLHSLSQGLRLSNSLASPRVLHPASYFTVETRTNACTHAACLLQIMQGFRQSPKL